MAKPPTATEKRDSQRQRIRALMSRASDLIEEPAYDASMQTLEKSLEYFCERQLAVVTPRLPLRSKSLTRARLRKKLDLSIADSDLPVPVKQFCTSHGVLFVGEIYVLRWHNKSHQKRLTLVEFLAGLGLPAELDERVGDWSPGYLWSARTQELLNLPSHMLAFRGPLDVYLGTDGHHEREQHFVGQIIRFYQQHRSCDTNVGFLEVLQQALRINIPELHAGILMRDWRAPSRCSVCKRRNIVDPG